MSRGLGDVYKKQTQGAYRKTSQPEKEKLLYIGLGIIGLIGAFFMFRSWFLYTFDAADGPHIGEISLVSVALI
ncbi:hypothetical protein ACQ7CW_24810 [Chryseobacterium arthrosphaerae]|uniref:hypothetical protein n=1 Tax=Chryseobacterium arthrosphaerae TaxID=651561 RepID=UPI003D354D0F